MAKWVNRMAEETAVPGQHQPFLGHRLLMPEEAVVAEAEINPMAGPVGLESVAMAEAQVQLRPLLRPQTPGAVAVGPELLEEVLVQASQEAMVRLVL